MKTKTNFVVFAILSLLVGTAFASPLLFSELDLSEIKPFPEPPNGPKANIINEVLYANFSIQSNSEKEALSDLSYFVILNITNNSSDLLNVIGLNFEAVVPDYTYAFEDVNAGSSGTVHAWDDREAWVDGKYYNLTWVPNKQGEIGVDGFLGEFEPDSDGYWMQGVQICEEYAHYQLVYSKMNMNGTWVDVTGRLEYPTKAGWPPTKLSDGVIFSEIKFLSGGEFTRIEGAVSDLQIPTGVPIDFNECWEPHQSRLIVLMDSRSIPSIFYEPSKLELLETAKTSFITTVTGYLNTSAIGDQSTTENTTQVQLETTENGYSYSVLHKDPILILDSFGVEVFIEPRN